MAGIEVLIRSDDLELINVAAKADGVVELPSGRFLDETGRYGVIFSYVGGLPAELGNLVDRGEWDEVFDFTPGYLEDEGDLEAPYVFMQVLELRTGHVLGVSVISGEYTMATYIFDSGFEVTVREVRNAYEYPLDGC